MPVVRLSLGRFDPSSYDEVRRLLAESQTKLVPAIRALRGNIAYYVGLDRENSAMTNVSVWQTIEDAKQMASLQAMTALAQTFSDVGVRFERPITNHETLWTL